MQAGITNMKPGETAQLKVRSDYAYGSDGYRKRNGDVMVPPFATLYFQIKNKVELN
jgi:FKBP-type peptidyl-prolyl cis-trans isomerase